MCSSESTIKYVLYLHVAEGFSAFDHQTETNIG